MTLRLDAERKQLALDCVCVRLHHQRTHADDCADCESIAGQISEMYRDIRLEGGLYPNRIAPNCLKLPINAPCTGPWRMKSRFVPSSRRISRNLLKWRKADYADLPAIVVNQGLKSDGASSHTRFSSDGSELPELKLQNKVCLMSRESAPSILVFDVNETLLDITSLEPLFERCFSDSSVLREWFAQLILYSQTMTLSGLYTPFGELGIGTLRMVASIHGATIEDSDIDELKQRMGSMPAHPDVVPALTRLRDAGFRLVTLTNSASSSSPTPLERAGLGDFFEHFFSVESVGKFKPALATYRHVAQKMNVETSGLCLVACHLWDTIGAQAAGCRGALITRPHNATLPAEKVPTPDLVASDMADLTDQIILSWQVS